MGWSTVEADGFRIQRLAVATALRSCNPVGHFPGLVSLPHKRSNVGMGEVLLKTKVNDKLTGVMFAWMDPLITNVYSLAIVPFWTAFVYHIFLGNEVATPSTSLPALMNFAASRGLDPLALGMVWTFAGGSKIFVYQSSVLIVGYAYGYFAGRDMLRFGDCVTIVEPVILLLLVAVYWPLIGIG